MKLRRLLGVITLLSCSLMLYGTNYTGSLTVTTSGTARPLSAASPAPPTNCISLTVTAKIGNVGTIYVGGSNVSAASKIGAYINSSFPSAYFAPAASNPLYSPSQIYIDATDSGDGVSYACYK